MTITDLYPLVAAALALAALGVQQRRLSLRDLSAWHWRLVQRGVDVVREQFFTVNVGRRHLVVDAPIEDVRRALGEAHFTNSWELSYSYAGEDLNMRRPVYVDGDRPWRQDHVRGFKEGGRVVLECHRELEPTEYPYAHLRDEEMEFEPAVDVVGEVMADSEFRTTCVSNNWTS